MAEFDVLAHIAKGNLECLKVAVRIIDDYRIENHKLIIALTMVSKMAREGHSMADIAKFSDQALMLLKKK